MSSGVNKAILIGNLGADPEARYTQSGTAVTNLSVATNESWRDRQSGERKERVEWHRVVLFGKVAEVAGEYLRKGSQVYLEGQIRTRKWQDREGRDRYTTEIVANTMTMLGGPGRRESSGGAAGDGARHSPPIGGGSASDPGGTPDLEDDIPF